MYLFLEEDVSKDFFLAIVTGVLMNSSTLSPAFSGGMLYCSNMEVSWFWLLMVMEQVRSVEFI